jgi:hypothetical protein
LATFAHDLKRVLEVNTLECERAEGYMVHLAGYVKSQGQFHPEFWFIRNTEGIDPHSGEYVGRTSKFEIGEDFWSRDWIEHELADKFSRGEGWIYVNGFPAARIGLVNLVMHLGTFLQGLWSQPNWGFRQPRTISEEEIIARLYMENMCALFRVSDYAAPVVGGTVQSCVIPLPQE